MKIYKKRKFLFFVLIYLMLAQVVFAEGNEVKVGPELVGSTPQSGAVSVDLDTEIHLTFNKNVANMTVRENNRNNIRLMDGNGKEVQIEVIFADDQIEPEKRRDIIVKPIESLAGSSTYKLEILPDFMSKNGQTVGKLIELKFETKKEESQLPDRVEESNLESTEAKEVHLSEAEIPLVQKDENVEDEKIVEEKDLDDDGNDDEKDMLDEEEEDTEEETDEPDDIEEDTYDREKADDALDKTYEEENKPKNNLVKIISLSVIIFIVVAIVQAKRAV